MPTRSSLFILVLFSALLPNSARAQAPVYLWGIQRGNCEDLPDVDRLVEKRLHSASQSVALLRTPAGRPLPPCQGPRCAEILRASCPAAGGRLLGGQVFQGKNVTNFRLWLYDLATGQIAYQDDYCQSCSLSDAVIAQAKALIEKPRFGSVPGAKPAYCSPGSVEPPPSDGSAGPVLLTVYGDGKHKSALSTALREQLQALGHTVQPVSVEAKTYTLDILQRVVAGQRNARVLGAEVKPGGRVELFLFDQKTAQTDDESVHCPDCAADALTVRVKDAVSALLDHCFGLQCAGGTTATPPVEACEPFPEKQCPGLDGLLSPALALSPNQDRLTPRTAKLIKGSLWSLFAASAATAIALFAANSADTGVVRTETGYGVRNVLAAPAGAMAGVAGLTLILAIPTTLAVNRASAPSPSTNGSVPPSQIQCPN